MRVSTILPVPGGHLGVRPAAVERRADERAVEDALVGEVTRDVGFRSPSGRACPAMRARQCTCRRRSRQLLRRRSRRPWPRPSPHPSRRRRRQASCAWPSWWPWSWRRLCRRPRPRRSSAAPPSASTAFFLQPRTSSGTKIAEARSTWTWIALHFMGSFKTKSALLARKKGIWVDTTQRNTGSAIDSPIVNMGSRATRPRRRVCLPAPASARRRASSTPLFRR